MKNCIVILCLALLAGCDLSFGTDEMTTEPTQAQIDRCRQEMYLQANLAIQAQGMKLLGSGIDDQIWLKFSCDVTEPDQIFQSDVVDVAGFSENTKLQSLKDIAWWDIEGRDLSGGQVALPNARFMEVGIDTTDKPTVVFIIWFET